MSADNDGGSAKTLSIGNNLGISYPRLTYLHAGYLKSKKQLVQYDGVVILFHGTDTLEESSLEYSGQSLRFNRSQLVLRSSNES